MIFDEVDRGVGGAVASAIGERLARLAEQSQVLVVTHCPQVAARASHHYRIEKSHGADGTRTTVRKLERGRAARGDRAHAVGRVDHRRSAGAGVAPARRGMTRYVALLRGVNCRRPPAQDGRSQGDRDGARARVAPGPSSPAAICCSPATRAEATLKARRSKRRWPAHMGKTVEVMVRTAKEMAAVVAANPFADEPGNKVVAIFLDEPPPPTRSTSAKNVADERHGARDARNLCALSERAWAARSCAFRRRRRARRAT